MILTNNHYSYTDQENPIARVNFGKEMVIISITLLLRFEVYLFLSCSVGMVMFFGILVMMDSFGVGSYCLRYRMF